MHLSHIPQCTIQNRNVHISVLNGALWDMGQVHYGIMNLYNSWDVLQLQNNLATLEWRHLKSLSHLKSLASRLFAGPFVQAQIKENIKASLAFVRLLADSPRKGPVTRKMFPFDDIIMCFHFVMSSWRVMTTCAWTKGAEGYWVELKCHLTGENKANGKRVFIYQEMILNLCMCVNKSRTTNEKYPPCQTVV